MQPLICTNCGKGIPAGSAFCLHCGAPVQVGQSRASVQPPQQSLPPKERYRQPTQYNPPPQGYQPPPNYQPTPPQPTPPQPYQQYRQPPAPLAGNRARPRNRAVALWGIIGLVVLVVCAAITANNGRQNAVVSEAPTAVTQNSTLGNPVTIVANAGVAATTTLAPKPAALPTLGPAQAAAATQTVGAGTAGSEPRGGSYYFADATSHSVDGFGDTFAKLGGVAALGYPITEPFIEQNSADSRFYWVQYFEKAELEYHLLDDASPYQLTALGTWRFSQKYAGGAPGAKAVPGSGGQTFPQTKHTVSGLFLAYWKSNGDLARFGYPISESFDEKNDATGKTYTVQYFERVEMEYHPELKAGSQVQLAALGTLKLGQVYAGGAPNGAGNPVPSPTVNAPATEQAQANASATALVVSDNATSTALVKTQNADATATAKKIAGYKTQPPSGQFEQRGEVAISCGFLRYQHTMGYESANGNSKFLTMSVAVTNNTGSTLYVNPGDFTIEGIDGYSVGYDASTFSFNTPFPSVELQPGAYANGGLSFLVLSDFVPAKLVWSGFLQSTVTVTIVPTQ